MISLYDTGAYFLDGNMIPDTKEGRKLLEAKGVQTQKRGRFKKDHGIRHHG